ncbi:Unknown protein [Striga hermonthica]|uniref:Gag1-like clamp domain-containing protein n=1 Tax=Striga hermonthica TaxID=68872 RepID=A0A9N7NAA4_STRHE|nr:Unknown protein [Striga hermonthica]
MVGSLLRFGSIAVWVFHIIACMGCCLGCDNRPHLIPSLEESLKSQHNQHAWKKASKSTLSEDYWTTSTYDMDNAFQSCGSISSACTLTQTHDAAGAGSSYKSSDFVNHGLIQWNLIRKKWVGNNKSPGRAQQHHEPSLSWDATYDSLLSNNKPFHKPIPLAEMVDFLVDIWEQEGMYD